MVLNEKLLPFAANWIRFCSESVAEVLDVFLGPAVANVIAKSKNYGNRISFSETNSGQSMTVIEDCDSMHKTIVSPLSVATATITINHVEYTISTSFDDITSTLTTRRNSSNNDIEIVETRRLFQGFLEHTILVKSNGHTDRQAISWYSMDCAEEETVARDRCNWGQSRAIFELKAPVTASNVISAEVMLPWLANRITACQYILELQCYDGEKWVEPCAVSAGEHIPAYFSTLYQWSVSNRGCMTNPANDSIHHLRRAEQFKLLLPDLFVIFREFSFVMPCNSSAGQGWAHIAIDNQDRQTIMETIPSEPVVGQLRQRLWVRILVAVDDKDNAEADVQIHCPVGAQPVVCRGFVWKRGTFVKSWRKRMFVLREAHISYYDVNGSTPVLKGTFPLIGASVCSAVPSECFGQLFGFCLHLSSGETRYCAAPDDHHRDNWIAMISQVITNATAEAKPPVSIFPFCASDEIFGGSLFIQGRERNEWKLHKFSIRFRTLNYFTDANEWLGSMDLSHCTYTDNQEAECEFMLESSTSASERGIIDDHSRNVLRLLAANVEDKSKWRLAMHHVLKLYCENYSWSTFNFAPGELDIVGHSPEGGSSASPVDLSGVDYTDINSAVDDNMSAHTRTSASSTGSNNNSKPRRKSFFKSLSHSLRPKFGISKGWASQQDEISSQNANPGEPNQLVRITECDEQGMENAANVRESNYSDSESAVDSNSQPEEQPQHHQEEHMSAVDAVHNKSSSNNHNHGNVVVPSSEAKRRNSNIAADNDGADGKPLNIVIPYEIEQALQLQNINATRIFRGVWVLKKFSGELIFRKRFVWIDPVERTINWSKSKEDRDNSICKSLPLPLSALDIKPPVEKTQCFGITYGGTSIRIQLPLPGGRGGSKSKNSSEILSAYHPDTDAAMWIRVIHLLRTS